jgi:hypothetical protein
MRVLAPAFHQLAPGCEDDMLVFEGFFECGVEHGEHIGSSEGAAVADAVEVPAGVGAVHDHHGDAGLEAGEGVDVFGGAPMLESLVGGGSGRGGVGRGCGDESSRTGRPAFQRESPRTRNWWIRSSAKWVSS